MKLMRSTRPVRVAIFLVLLVILAGTAVFSQRRGLLLTRPIDPRLGERIFRQNCAACHGANAEGQDPAPPLNRMGHADHHPDWELYMFIAEGKIGFGQMPAWKQKLTEREIRAVIAYIKTLWTSDQRASQQHVNEVRPAPPDRQ